MWVKTETTASGGDDYINLNNCTLIAAHPHEGKWSISARDLNDTSRRLACVFDSEEEASDAVRRLVNGIDPQAFA